ncbi:MAG TPA: selenocysteine-specific translation elongation factor [Candidatus Limnocylindrales bacterium]|nr:selenocysteine-specific translation elongation factor [Candidatus Limnocylindrales bacterium]
MTTNFKSIIVGTAGHIDHGKSSLIEALTGTHPDRLEEEKRRGITIDLGFAFLEDEGIRYGFVDVPGHERFVKNMLAGASGIDLVLLVVATDELIKPQTREHFDICRLLGVQRGVIALTKSDLADSDTRELARMEIEEFVKGTFLASAPIIDVSAKTQSGLAELKAALRETAREISAKDTGRYFRLPIDRSFAVKGFGSVVTGTLFSGQVAVGDEVELLPSGKLLRVRGLQTGGKSVEQAEAGQRTAVNLAGIEHTAIQRGMVLTSGGRLRTTRRADVRLELLPGAPVLKHRAQVHFHAGTLETIGEVYLLGARELAPGGSALAQIRLQDEAVLVRGDRFIVRQFSPVVTIGGGAVLDPHARRFSAKDTGRAQFLEMLEKGSREEILQAMAERNILGITAKEIIVRTGWIEQEIQSAAYALAEKKLIRIVSNEPLILIAEVWFTEISKKLLTRVERFHKENPLLPGITREELKASLGRRIRPETFAGALQLLLEQKKINQQGEFIKKTGSEITLSPEELRAQEQITQAFAKAGLAVPSVKEVLAQLRIETPRAEKLLQILLREKVLVRVSVDLIFHRDALIALTALLAHYKKSKGDRISVPAFKELTGITRKYAIPLLEYLDRQRQTRRAGDERVIL